MRASLPGLIGLLCTGLSFLLVDGALAHPPDPVVVPYSVERFSEAELPLRGRLDVNQANAQALEALPGIGPATAAAILEDRARRGPFAGVEDLLRVKGIGPAKLEAVRPFVTVTASEQGAAAGVRTAPGR